MNPFRKLGRSAQRLKRKAPNVGSDETLYVCKTCEAQFEEESQTCPECESTEILVIDG